MMVTTGFLALSELLKGIPVGFSRNAAGEHLLWLGIVMYSLIVLGLNPSLTSRNQGWWSDFISRARGR